MQDTMFKNIIDFYLIQSAAYLNQILNRAFYRLSKMYIIQKQVNLH